MTQPYHPGENRLTILSEFMHRERDGRTKRMANCECVCGTRFVTRKSNITRGITKSCGCWRASVTAERNRLRAKGKAA